MLLPSSAPVCSPGKPIDLGAHAADEFQFSEGAEQVVRDSAGDRRDFDALSTNRREFQRAEIRAGVAGQKFWLKDYVAGRLVRVGATGHSFEQAPNGDPRNLLDRLGGGGHAGEPIRSKARHRCRPATHRLAAAERAFRWPKAAGRHWARDYSGATGVSIRRTAVEP